MMLMLAVAVYAAYLAFNFVQMRRTGSGRHAWAWIILFGIGLAVQALFELGVDVYGPAEPITNIITGLFPLE